MFHQLILVLSSVFITTQAFYQPRTYPHTLLNLQRRLENSSAPIANSTFDMPPPVGTCTWLPSAPMQTCFPWPQASGNHAIPSSSASLPIVTTSASTVEAGYGATQAPWTQDLQASTMDSLIASITPSPTEAVSGSAPDPTLVLSILSPGLVCTKTTSPPAVQVTSSTAAAPTYALETLSMGSTSLVQSSPAATTTAPASSAPSPTGSTHPRCRKK